MMNKKLTIYLDMDGVVADLQAASAIKLQSVNLPQNYSQLSDEQWATVDWDPRMFRDLPVLDGAQELVDWVTRYAQKTGSDVFFLTALPNRGLMQWAAYDKVFWAHQHWPHIPVFFGPYSQDKCRHVQQPTDILIDDRALNIQQWRAAGARGHEYTTWPLCKLWLEQTLGSLGN